jgi:protein-disulfide isomerase-like protein with CxxC motif
MGIADCQIEKGLCDHLNITHFPTLTLLTSNSMTVLDEYKLLEHEGLISSEDPKVQLNEVITLLQRKNK